MAEYILATEFPKKVIEGRTIFAKIVADGDTGPAAAFIISQGIVPADMLELIDDAVEFELEHVLCDTQASVALQTCNLNLEKRWKIILQAAQLL